MLKKKLKIQIFADGANIREINNLKKKKFISGFTTNPSLMKKSGVKDYEKFLNSVTKLVKSKSISFEVFSDTIAGMEKQAKKISSYGKNIAVKIPITNTKGVSTVNLVHKLNREGIKCNVTGVFTLKQVKGLLKNFPNKTEMIVSIFAGRIADTGIDPKPLMSKSVKLSKKKKIKILWASPRELWNLFEADKLGCHIITIPYDIINKFNLINKNLNKYSIETIKTFHKDAKMSGFKI
ncbi:transaldolase [Candidatus Pelagibacter sp.]|uniref:transaldolase n=1 Tax=Candidatus Pelagibacter sp. TaxID=2024849 RepID=UPI003D0A76EA